MNPATNNNDDGTPRASQLSPTSANATLSPTWAPPKSPLPPHRLAKLANALGVSTPVPASRSPSSSFLSRSISEAGSPVDPLRRSPTPSATPSSMGFNSYSSTTSKFMLHVIPPLSLPHDSDDGNDTRRLPTPNAPGYHRQFRRGTLVPVHATLQAQLGAIAREYALPSTAGLILYLINATPQSPSPFSPDGLDEPGPRLSEEIWKHLWTRVVRTERRDDMLLPSRSPTPLSPGTPHMLSAFSPAARSAPYLPQENGSSHLRPLMTSPSGPEPIVPHAPQPMYTAPSTPSSVSDIRSNSKSAPPSSVSQSEPGTPDTSVEDSGIRANSLDLPGLNSPSLIPILAKVEFDIDRRKAGWYEPWLRSRKVNHAKRTGSRNGTEDSTERSAPLELVTVKRSTRKKKDPFGISSSAADDEEAAGYARLSDSPLEMQEDEESDGEDVTAKFGGKDPLADIFGTDADTWADIRNGGSGRRRKHGNPNVVDLALTGGELSTLSDPRHLEHDSDAESSSTREENEVMEMLEKMGSGTLGNGRKVPPPLKLKHKGRGDPSAHPAQGSASSTDLAYMEPSYEDADEYSRQRDSDKRTGAVFDDLDLGLDPTEDFDANDPNDHRRSQLIMRAQLDEIEKTMAQLSPRFMHTNLEDQQDLSFNSATLSPSSPARRNLSPVVSPMLSPRSFNSNFSPPSPRLPRHPSPPQTPIDTEGKSWPAVPFSSLKDRPADNPNSGPAPPQLAVNGITTSAPKSYTPTRVQTSGASESEKRRKELEDENGFYMPKTESPNSESPVIPLSPDPFGRFPSPPKPPRTMSGAQWDTITMGRGSGEEPEAPVRARARSTASSRFSADSITGEERVAPSNASVKAANRTTLMSVKSIKKLWRKSKDKSVGGGSGSGSTIPTPPVPSSASTSGRVSPMVPQRPERHAQDQLDLPDMPDIPPTNFGRLSPSLPQQQQQQQSRPSLDTSGRRTPQDQLMPPPTPTLSSMDTGGRRTPQDLMPPPHPRASIDQGGQRIPQDMMPPPHPRASIEQGGRRTPQDMMPPHASRPSVDQLVPQSGPPPQPGLSLPQYHGWNPKAGPITTPHMQASRSAASLDRLHFDQESPYPIRLSTSARQSPRPPSPPPLPAIPEQEKNVARKSILKWRNTANGTSNGGHKPSGSTSEPQPRQSFERPGASTGSVGRGGGRRPSVINFGSTRASVSSNEIPPSPPIPNQFTAGKGVNGQRPTMERQPSSGGRSTSSRDSQSSRPSFDASQFEFVSPKAGTLNYPYTSNE